MNFRTELTAKVSDHTIGLNDTIITLGSCFSDDIGKRFIDYKFKASKNPFGTVYNPISIHKILNHSIQNSIPSPNGFVERDGIFFHYDFHSSWNDDSRNSLETKLVKEINALHSRIKSGQYLIITYGTSWVYEEKTTKEIVANCHKVPQSKFDKFLLTQKRIIESFDKLYEDLKKLNKYIRILLTVSPVRHIKDTLELNSVSKSILRLSCHTLTEFYPDVEYFPSYEIIMDDLRDYRFYKADLIHPSEMAIDYIWEKFGETYFTPETIQFIHDWTKIRSAFAHKSFRPNSSSHQQFLKATLQQLNKLSATVDVKEEVNYFKGQIID